MADIVKKQLYVISVDKICNNCGFRNIMNETFDEHIEIIACGKCGNFINLPDDMVKEDKDIVRKIIDTAIKEKE